MLTPVPNLEVFEDQAIEALPRRTELGDLNFDEVAGRLRNLAPIVRAFYDLPDGSIPASFIEGTNHEIERLTTLVESVRGFALTGTTDPTGMHHNLTVQVNNHCDDLVLKLRPQLRSSDLELSAQIAALKAAVEETKGLATKVREAAGDAGAGVLSENYDDQATKARKAAKRFLIAAVILAVVLVASAIVIAVWFFQSPTSDSTTSWIDFARGALVKLVGLGVLSYSVVFCVKTYRSNMHIAVVAEQKANALKTYKLFDWATESVEARDVVTATLVQAVFSTGDSGFLSAGSEQSPLGLDTSVLRALLASRNP